MGPSRLLVGGWRWCLRCLPATDMPVAACLSSSRHVTCAAPASWPARRGRRPVWARSPLRFGDRLCYPSRDGTHLCCAVVHLRILEMVKSVVIALSFLFFCHGFEIESLFGEMVPASWFGLTGQRAGVLVGLIWQVIDGPAEPTCAQIPRHPSSPVLTHRRRSITPPTAEDPRMPGGISRAATAVTRQGIRQACNQNQEPTDLAN